MSTAYRKCETCVGLGRLMQDGSCCPACNGAGRFIVDFQSQAKAGLCMVTGCGKRGPRVQIGARLYCPTCAEPLQRKTTNPGPQQFGPLDPQPPGE